MNGLLVVVVVALASMWQWLHVQQPQTMQTTALQLQMREQQQLHALAAQLLQFAAQQGYNSHSHIGHMPCPASTPGGPARVACSQATQRHGYLPLQVQTGINYHNPALPAVYAITEISTAKHWQYAVSPQLVQPNTLNWSRWVNLNLPPLRLQLPNGQMVDAAAVVAKALSRMQNDQYQVTAPFTVVSLPRLQQYIQNTQMQQAQHHVLHWLTFHQAPYAGLPSLPNLTPAVSPLGNQFTPVDSGCACRCTKTQCTCNCTGTSATWVSGSACDTAPPQCKPIAPQTVAQRTIPSETLMNECHSSTAAPCVFKGPAGLATAWPISRYEPLPAINRSCRPTTPHTCPVSINNTACRCEFAWPEASKALLTRMRLTTAQPQSSTMGFELLPP